MQFLKRILFRSEDKRIERLESRLSQLIEKNKGLARDVASLSEAMTEITKVVTDVARTNQALYSDLMLVATLIKDLSPAPRGYDNDNLLSPFPKDDDDGYLN